MRRPARRPLLVIGAVVLALAVAFGANALWRWGAGEQEAATDAAFYELPGDLPAGEPGEIIRSAKIEGAPLGSTAWRVIYHSRDLAGADVPVSGVIVVPDGPAPEGGRSIVAWAHPTTGAAAACAPSLAVDPFEVMEGVHELLDAGYVVTATDYQGLGIEGASSYLLGIPESNNVLDSARAARALPGTGASERLMLWGHSQGGQAALFAAERAAAYAPEFTLEGVAVAAPAANLNALMSDDIIDLSGVTIAALAIPAYEAAYADQYSKDEIDAILTPAGAAATPQMAELCLLTQTKELHAIADPLIGGYVTSDPATTEPWQTMLQQNSAGNSPITVPVFVAQGLADRLVHPDATKGYVQLLCSQGTDVSFHELPDVTHGLIAEAAVPELMLWLAQVDTAHRPASTC
ncbi:lipase family protein [Herbiconiux sp.]|uniref:lipase family protein n=1 Tax=Herbiconiux sp. TaxID=1871186 RepID=UPI0025BB8418|nr:lipase family protein [Herbiconiux sp.]